MMNLKNLQNLGRIAHLNKHKVLADVRQTANKLSAISRQITEIHEKTVTFSAGTEFVDSQVLERWLEWQNEKLVSLAELQHELRIDLKAIRGRAKIAVGRLDVIEQIDGRDIRARKRKVSFKVP